MLKHNGVDSYLTDNLGEADIIVDDIIDSGATKERALNAKPNALFLALVDKTSPADKDMPWVVFPWEVTSENAEPDDIVTRLLQYIGEDVTRGGLLETPKRVLKAWKDMTAGYSVEPKALLKTFDDGAEGVDEMVTVQDIPVWSLCEHHMLPFFGTATISYIPSKRIVGLSKLARVVDAFARRLQVQERLTNQIADVLQTELQPLGVGVHLRCRHLCMEARGVKTHNSNTVTTALRGVIKDEPATRSEFLRLTQHK
jgi:GTP cyclohydrolase I